VGLGVGPWSATGSGALEWDWERGLGEGLGEGVAFYLFFDNRQANTENTNI